MNFTTSASTKKLDAALAKAQGEFAGATKDALNPHFKSKYADLSAVWDVIRGPLSKHGLAISQWPVHSDDNRMHLVTRLACSGEWIMATYSSPVGAQTAQAMGSAITYAKRYTLMAILGIPSEDDDGEAASNRSHTIPPPNARIATTPAPVITGQVVAPKSEALPSQPNVAAPKTVSEAQLARLFAIAHERGWKEEQVGIIARARFGVQSRKELSIPSYNNLVALIERYHFKDLPESITPGSLQLTSPEQPDVPHFTPQFGDEVPPMDFSQAPGR